MKIYEGNVEITKENQKEWAVKLEGGMKKLKIETNGRLNEIKRATLGKVKIGLLLSVDTKSKYPDSNIMSGQDKHGKYSGVSIFGGHGMQSVYVYGEYDAVLYTNRYGPAVLLLAKDALLDGEMLEEVNLEKINRREHYGAIANNSKTGRRDLQSAKGTQHRK